MYLIDTHKYDDSFLLAKILEKVDFTDEETKKLFKHFEIPTANVVKVVRCKDCEHLSGKDGDRYCYLDGRGITEEDYCSKGERNE